MKVEDFQVLAPGELVPTEGGAVAFVPSPLPEELPIDTATVRLLVKAENALGRLAGTTGREFNPYLVSSPMLHREAILSSRIEGTITTPEQLVLIQAEDESSKAHVEDEDTREVLNYMRAMVHGLERLKELPVCLRLIREIHRTLLGGVRGERERPGEFRTYQNWIRGRLDDRIQNARFVPPPVREMNQALADFERYLNRSPSEDHDPLLVQLALIHYQFETIHPFRDGNGRVGRLLIPLLLCSHKRLDAPILYLSAFFERRKDLYVDLLLHVSRTGEWKPWVDFFLRGVWESAEEAVQQANALLALRQRYHRQFQSGRSSALLIRLVDRLFEVPSITIKGAARLLGVTAQAGANNVRKLQEAGILQESTGRRRGQVFIAGEIMRFLYDHGGENPSDPAQTSEAERELAPAGPLRGPQLK